MTNPVHSAYGLELMSRIKDWLHQQNVSGLNDVQTIGASVERKQEDVDPFIVLEGAQVFLKMWKMHQLDLWAIAVADMTV